MRLLLDTHVLIWWLEEDDRLLAAHRALIEDVGNQVLISSVSAAEIAIKTAIGKLKSKDDIIGVATVEEGFDELSFTMEHCDMMRELPLMHKDPFDRMLVAQAIVEDAVLLTVDQAIRQYAVPTV